MKLLNTDSRSQVVLRSLPHEEASKLREAQLRQQVCSQLQPGNKEARSIASMFIVCLLLTTTPIQAQTPVPLSPPTPIPQNSVVVVPDIAPAKSPTPSLTPQLTTSAAGIPIDPLSPVPPHTTPIPNGAKEFTVLAQTGHFPDWLQALFSTKLGVPVKVQSVATPEEELAALSDPAAHFDLALVADRIIPPLEHAGALRALPPLPDFGIDHRYLGHGFIDRDNYYALPYGWSLLTLAYRTTAVHSGPQHWADLDAPGVASQLMVADVPSLKPLDDKGRTWAIAKHLPVPGGDPLSGPLPAVAPASANYWVAPYGKIRVALANQPTWKMILPEEGSIIFLYHVVLPKSGLRPDLAEQAVPILFDPAVSSKLDAQNALGTTQSAAQALIPPDQAHDPLLYPPNPILSRCIFSHR